MAINISTDNIVIARYAGALYDLALDNKTMNSVIVATATGFDEFMNAVFIRDFSEQTTAQVAATMVKNLGLTGAAEVEAEAYIIGTLNGVPAAVRGTAVVTMLNLFGQMTNDPYYGTFATAWESKVSASAIYSQNPSSTNTTLLSTLPPPPVVVGFTLTNGTDIATDNVFNAGLVYTPGGDDRINSLQDEDQLTGTGTDATLNATLGNSNDNGGTVITPTLKNIPVINAAFTGSGPFNVIALDLQDATEVAQINITRIAQGKSAEIGNIKQAAAVLSLANTNANQADTVEFSYATNVLKGENTGSITLSDVDVLSLNIGQNTSGITVPGVATNGFEHLTINSITAANTVRNMQLPMDTGTTGSITITGDQNLTIATTGNIVNQVTPVLVEATSHAGGIALANGRLASIDASGMTGTASLTLTIAAGLLSTGKAGTSGAPQDVTITGTGNADTFYLYDTVQAGDKIIGGLGADKIVVYTGGVTTGTVSSIEAVDIQLVGNVVMDFDKIADATTINVRNIDNAQTFSWDQGNWTATLNNLTAVQAAALSTQHSTTNNGSIVDTTITANLKVSTNAADLVGVTILEGVNTDPRFNFTLTTNQDLVATAAVERVESITITDSDSESNTVELTNFVDHTGTVTLTGGVAGTFLNLDVNTALAPADAMTVTGAGFPAAYNAALVAVATTQAAYAASATVANLAAYEAAIAAATSVTGLNMIDVTGGNADGIGRQDVGALATQVRLVAGIIDAANEASDVIVRVSTTAANTNGGQTITMGAGNDTVIFDDVAATSITRGNAGLTNADTVIGGAGNNTLVIDGNGVNVVLQQSEWDHVSDFQTVYLAGNGAGNQYFLQIDNDMITANGTGGNMINIVNDDNSTVSTATNVDSRISNTAVRLDATTLSADKHFTYNGEEGSGSTLDRFVVNDQNTNGGNIIDGGDVSVLVGVDASGVTRQLTGVRSGDVLEVRNTATVTTADLTGVSNVGSIVINNDQAVLQTLNLSLNSSTIDAMSDSGHTASLTETETLIITANDGLMADAAGSAIVPSAASRIVLDARSVSGAFGLTVTGDTGFSAADNISMAVNLGGAASTFNLALGTDTVSFYGLNTATDTLVITASGANNSAVTFANASGLATQNFTLTSTEAINVFTSAGVAATLASSTITGTTTATAITGTNVADTISAAASVAAVTVTGAAGADTMTGSNVGVIASTFVVGNTDSGLTLATADTITNFVAATDFLSLGVAGTATNFTNGGASASFAAARIAADASFAADVGGAQEYYVGDDGVNTYVFIDNGADGVAAEQVIQLTGVIVVAAANILV